MQAIYRGNVGSQVELLCIDPYGWALVFVTSTATASDIPISERPSSPAGVSSCESRVFVVQVGCGDDDGGDEGTSVGSECAVDAHRGGALQQVTGHLVRLTCLPYKVGGRVTPCVDRRCGVAYAAVAIDDRESCNRGLDVCDAVELVALRVAGEHCIDCIAKTR